MKSKIEDTLFDKFISKLLQGKNFFLLGLCDLLYKKAGSKAPSSWANFCYFISKNTEVKHRFFENCDYFMDVGE